MASVFILGPSHWENDRGRSHTPWDIRLRIADILSKRHTAYLMEDVQTAKNDRDLTDKFLRILDERKTSHVLLYWPRDAKMQTTLDEIIHLRHAYDQRAQPEVRILSQAGIILIQNGRYELTKDTVSRSRYLDSLNTLRIILHLWIDEDDLYKKIRALSEILV